MIIADSNFVIHCLNENIEIPINELVVPDDLYGEYEVIEARHRKQLGEIKRAVDIENYDEAYFLQQYAKTLNGYPGLQFARMKNFGDASIVALLSSIQDNFGRGQPQLTLDIGDAKAGEPIAVITDDDGLKTAIESRFDQNLVRVLRVNEYKP